MSANTAFFIGNVATKITVERFTRADGELLDKARCLVAVSRLGKRGADGEEPSPDFVPVEAWGALARALAQFNDRGSKIGVTGRIRSEFYKPEGQEKGSLRTAVVAERIDFLTPKRKETVAADQTETVPAVEAPRPVATAARERRQ
jgi:single-stranded DNA-binding protein